MTTIGNPNLHNPHLDGDSFFWQGGPAGILLAHGYTATAGEVRPLVEKLRQKGYTIAAPLLPGHGTHPDDLNRVRWQDWVAAGQQALDRLFETCEQVIVGGESMGGVLALYLAAKNPQVKAVLLYAPAIQLTASKFDRLKLYLAAPFISQLPRQGLDCPDTWQGYPNVPLKGAIQLLHFQAATLPLLPKIHQPVQIFQARLDRTVAAAAGDIILNGVSSQVKELHWMEKSHHTILLDVELDDVTAKTLAFLERYA
jgi:carboxylesterase